MPPVAVLVTILGSLGGAALLITALLGIPAYLAKRRVDETDRRVSVTEVSIKSLEAALERADKDRADDRERFERRISELTAEMRGRDERCAASIDALAEQVRGLGGSPVTVWAR